MHSKQELLTEAYNRGILPPDMKNAYEEAVNRGLITKQTTAGDEIVRPLARAARTAAAGLGGIADIGGMAVEPIRQGLRAGLEKAGVDFMGQNTPYTPPSQGIKNLFDSATGGLAAPRSGSERIVDQAGEFVAGGGGAKIAQSLAKGTGEIAKKLAPQTGKELASYAGAGAGAEIGSQVDPESPIAPVIGALVGGAMTVKGLNTIRNSGDIANLDAAYFNRKALASGENKGGYFDKQANKLLEKRLPVEKAQALKGQLEEDKNLVLADIGGDEVRALTRQVGKFSGGARNIVDKYLTTRDRGTQQRVINLINSKVSGVDKYYGSLDEMAAVRSELAKNQYDDAFTKHARMKQTPSLDKFVQDGRFQDALSEARQKNLVNIEEPVNSLRTMDAIYKRLRDKANTAYVSGAKEEGKVYGDFARDFVKALDAQAPEYAKARNTFAGFSDLIASQEMGKGYAKLTPEQINRDFKALTKSEQDAFKIGVRESLQNEVLKTGGSANEANKVFGRAMQRQQLKQILGDEYDAFSRQMRKEIRMADTKFRVLGGSRTDYNVIDDDKFIENAARVAKGGKGALIGDVIDASADWIKKKYMGINERNADILSKALVTNKGGIKILDDMIAKSSGTAEKKSLEDFKQTYGHLLTPVAISSGGN